MKTTVASLADLRAIYNATTTHQRVTDVVAEVVYPESDYGEVRITPDALAAINADNLFSGRWHGDALDALFWRALDAAAVTTDPEAPWLVFTLDFGRLGRVTLRARQTGEGIAVLPE